MPRLIRAALEGAGIEDAARVSTGVDVVGDVAIVRLADFSLREKKKVASSLLDRLKNVAVILEQEGGIEGEFRLRRLRHIAGEKRTLTVHHENGCAFRVDVARCYFSPRLSTERLHIAQIVGEREAVLNMFAGVGPFSIPIAKFAKSQVMSCEINRLATELHEENNRLNKVEERVEVVCGDAANLPEITKKKFDRVLMPLPSEAHRFLPTALAMVKKKGTIHYYRHVLGRNEAEATDSLRSELVELLPKGVRYRARRVREVGPRWFEMAADIRVPA